MNYKKIKKTIFSLLLGSSMLLSLTGCGSSKKNAGVTDVRIAYFPNITHSQALVLKEKKTLENTWGDKCNVSWISFNAGPEEMEAIFANEVDLGYIGPVPALSANAKSNSEVKILSNSTNAGAVLLKRKDAGIESVSDLAGKTIAVPQLGNTQHLCLLNLLNTYNLKTTDEGGDVTVTASSNADILNLIDNGSVDAALVPEPWGTTIEKNGNAKILLDYDEIFLSGNYPTAVVIVREEVDLAGALALKECGHNSGEHCGGNRIVTEAGVRTRGDLLCWAPFGHHAAASPEGCAVEAGTVPVGAFHAEARAHGVDELGAALLYLLIPDAEPFKRLNAGVGHKDVRPLKQGHQRLAPLIGFEVETEAALVHVVRLEYGVVVLGGGKLPRAADGAVRLAFGRFDLDNIRAPIRAEPGNNRRRDMGSKLYNTDTFKRSHRLFLLP